MSRIADLNDLIPKYYKLINMIRQKIEDGEWTPHEAIPSERQLETLYNLSRTTIRQAVGILIRQGYLYREHGRGTFVSPQKLQKGITELTSFTEDMRNRGLEPGQIILEIGGIKPSRKVLQQLELPPDTESIFHIERIRLANSQPMGLQVSYLALAKDQVITREELEENGSLYNILREKYNIVPTEAEETLEVTLATYREAALLQVKEGSPLLLSQRTLWSQNRRAIEYVKILYRGDRYKYYVKLTR
jgi:GntR family transcriptional regulator